MIIRFKSEYQNDRTDERKVVCLFAVATGIQCFYLLLLWIIIMIFCTNIIKLLNNKLIILNLLS